uniref:Dynein light chain n=1 Tax=Kalanchoe fedtschenkoi TaxID=63787 RepID=A0A7N0UCL8_KALFE
MDGAELELERRSKFLSSLVQHKKSIHQKEQPLPPPPPPPKQKQNGHLQQQLSIRVRAADMPASLQMRAVRCAKENLGSVSKSGKVDSKRIALALKKEFDLEYGPAWHCIVGTSFGSYVTHSLGGFLYFSIDKVYILLFRTAVEPLSR